ncbi:hypothetical protein M422DRAFT_275313 [Sphaerobolus stellatus SS14]|uniref:Uncharacterized protein n=1 Tax=Sphaerobolus stellatus (strain SS14) TaxID=990650 RepID=A0A0C9TQ10_SPHS4|nr:hypothetical protein M422DRAFT_275313 [Sphaerobolus stellatus SS14]
MKDEADAKAWADLKWRRFIGQDNVLAQLSVDCSITVRGDQEGHTIITTHEREWSKSVSVALVKNWTDEMDEGSFSRDSTIEKFQFIYAVAMDWLASLIHTAAPDLLRKYTRVLKSGRFVSHQKPKPIQLKQAAQGRSNEKNGFVSGNSMDLDMPPQTLQIPESPLKTGKGATTPELISKERGEERPTPLTPMRIESRSSDGEFEGAIVVDTPRRKCKLPDSKEPTTQQNLHVMKKLKPSDDFPATEQSEAQAGDTNGSSVHTEIILMLAALPDSPAESNPVSGKKRGRKPKVEASEVVLTSEATEPATTKRMSTSEKDDCWD